MLLCPTINKIWELVVLCTLLRGSRYALLLLSLKGGSGDPKLLTVWGTKFNLYTKSIIKNAGCASDIQFLNVLCLLEFTDSHSGKYRVYWDSQMSVALKLRIA